MFQILHLLSNFRKKAVLYFSRATSQRTHSPIVHMGSIAEKLHTALTNWNLFIPKRSQKLRIDPRLTSPLPGRVVVSRGVSLPAPWGGGCGSCLFRPRLRPGEVGVACFPGFVKELNRDFTPVLLHYNCNLFNRVVTVSNAKVSNGSFA